MFVQAAARHPAGFALAESGHCAPRGCAGHDMVRAIGRSATVGLGGRDQPHGLHLGLLGDLRRIVDLGSKVSDGALKLAVAKQKLHCPQVFGPTVRDRTRAICCRSPG